MRSSKLDRICETNLTELRKGNNRDAKDKHVSDVDDFLAHHGVKGMRWGVTRSNSAVKTARKTARKQNVENLQGRYTKTGADGKTKVKKAKVAGIALDVMTTGGMYTASQIARSAGYTKGQSVAIGMLTGPIGATLASEVRVRRSTSG